VKESPDAGVIEDSLRDPSAFADIFDRHYDAIHDYLARRLPVGLSEEVASQVFLLAFERRRSFDPTYASARPWLFGIATNLVSRHRRDEQRRIAAYGLAAQVAASGDDLDDALERADAAASGSAIATAISVLDPSDRDTLLLHVLGDLTYGETAEALGVPVGTVKSRLHRARTELTRSLAQEGVHAND
jgi:RNA polymerase sigma-70 factor (ECF subfamily)